MLRVFLIIAMCLSAALSYFVGRSFVTYKVHAVLSGSMGSSVPKGSIIFSAPQEGYEVGEVIVYRHPLNEAELITHRVIRVTLREGLAYYETKGDANPNGDGWTIPRALIVGKVHTVIPGFGFGVLALQTAPGYILFALVSLVLFVFPLFRGALRELKEFRDLKSSGSIAS